MSAAIQAAYVSGPLRQAVFVEDGRSKLLDLSQDELPRETTPNDLAFFFSDAVEFRPVTAKKAAELSVDALRDILVDEARMHEALDALIGGMDRRFGEKTRQRKIAEADRLLAEPEVQEFVGDRLYSAMPTPVLDPAGALDLARGIGARLAERVYFVIAADGPGKAEAAFADAARAHGTTGTEALSIRAQFVEAGAYRQVAESLALGEAAKLQNAIFELAQGKLRASSATAKRILFALAKSNVSAAHISRDVGELQEIAEDETEANTAEKSLEEVIQEAANKKKRGVTRRTVAPDDLLARILREIAWIENRLGRNDIARAEGALEELVRYQLEVSRPEDVVKTLTSIGNSAAACSQLVLANRCLDLAEMVSVDDPVVAMSRAWLLHLAGDDQAAIAKYDTAIERFPTDAFGYTGRAETLRALGRLEEALAQYGVAIERFPTNAFGYTGRAETLRALGRLEEALAQYGVTIERFPTEAVGYNGRAETLRSLGRLEEALAQYGVAIENFPTDVFGYNGRAETLRTLGRLEDALAQYGFAIERFPTNAVAYRGRAETLRALGRLEEALAQYGVAIERFPTDVFGYTGRAETLRSLGRLEEALAQYGVAIERFPTDAVGYNGRAETLRALGRLEEALTQYEVVIERFPTTAAGYNGRAETLRALGRLEEALAQYGLAIERFPTDAFGYTGRAETLRALGRLEEALNQYDATTRRFPSNAFARNGRAHVLILTGDVGAARAALRQTGHPVTVEDWVAEHILAMADLREAKLDEAIAKLAQGSESCPFVAQRKIFLTTLTVSRLRKSRQDAREIEKAANDIERLKPAMSSPAERGVVLLLSAHVAGARKNRPQAERCVSEARTIVSAEDFARKRLERELVRRFQLFEPAPRSLPKSEEAKLDDAVFEAEFQLLAA